MAGAPGPTTSLGKSHGLEYMRAKFTGVTSQAAQPANCDGDAELTGGGGSIGGPVKTTVLNGTFPTDPAGWEAQGDPGGVKPRTLAAYAICGARPTDHEMTGLIQFDSNTTYQGFGEPCGSGLPLSGGMRLAQPAPYTWVISTFPVVPPNMPVEWATSAANRSQTEDTLAEFHSVCSDVYDVRYRYSDPTRMKPLEAGVATASCKRKEAVLGGGFQSKHMNASAYQTPALATRPADSRSDRDKVPDDGWQARAFNTQEFNVNLIAIAVCKR
jgi:hypothetical protein